MPFNEFRQNRFDIIKSYRAERTFGDIPDDEKLHLLLSIYKENKELLEPVLPFMLINENASTEEALDLLTETLINTVPAEYFKIDESDIKVEIPLGEFPQLYWIPIRDLLEFRKTEIFPMICYLMKNIQLAVQCEEELFRGQESDYIKEELAYCEDVEDKIYSKHLKKTVDLYKHYTEVFRDFKGKFTEDEMMKAVEKQPILKDFFKDAIAFIKDYSYSSDYCGTFTIDNMDGFYPIMTDTFYNTCWSFTSNLNRRIISHINSIGNEGGFVAPAYFAKLNGNDHKKQKEKFLKFHNLFSKQYDFYKQNYD